MQIKNILGWIASVSSAIVFAAPANQFIKVVKGNLNYDDVSTILVGTIYCNCLAWYIYGDLIFNKPLKTCNLLGCCLSLLFIIIYLAYEIKKYIIDAILNAMIVSIGTWASYRILTIILPNPAIAGKVCFATSFIALMYPLHLIYRAIKENNYRLISFEVAALTMTSGFFWAIYGIIEWDLYIFYPNLFSAFIAFIQIIIIKSYKIKYSTREQVGSPTIEIEIESNGDNDASKKQNSVDVKTDEGNFEEEGKMIAKPVKFAMEK